MKFDWIKRRNKLTLDEAWDEVDSNTGKLVCLKDGFLAQYDTKSKTYYVSNSKKDLACDKGMIIYDSLTPIFFTVPRTITSSDILPLLEYFCPKFYGGLISIVALLNRRSDLVPGVKKEAPEFFKAVKLYGPYIGYMDNPSDKVQLEAVKQYGASIRYIDNPSERVQVAAVKEDWVSIRDIDNPSEKVQLLAVNQDTDALGQINNPTDKVQLEAISQDPYAIQYIRNPSEELQLKAVNKDAFAIDYIAHPSEKVCKVAHTKGF